MTDLKARANLKNKSPNRETSFRSTRIYFGGIAHIAFKRSELIGFQSWKSRNRFYVELAFKNQANILAEYDSEEKWAATINCLECELED